MAINDPITAALFWSRVETGGKRQCWPWTGRNVRGYGVWRGQKAHREAYRFATGEIPDGMVIRHTCDNPACCNPDHLKVGTQADNIADAMSRRRNARGERHGRSTLTDADVQMIRDNPEGLSVRQLAERIGVSYHAVYDVSRGRNWGATGRGTVIRPQA